MDYNNDVIILETLNKWSFLPFLAYCMPSMDIIFKLLQYIYWQIKILFWPIKHYNWMTILYFKFLKMLLHINFSYQQTKQNIILNGNFRDKDGGATWPKKLYFLWRYHLIKEIIFSIILFDIPPDQRNYILSDPLWANILKK